MTYTILLMGRKATLLVQALIEHHDLKATVTIADDDWSVNHIPFKEFEILRGSCVVETDDAQTAVMLKMQLSEYIFACE